MRKIVSEILMNLASISLTIPKKNNFRIDRTNIIETIENLFKSQNVKFVFINGEKGIGKTELLRQFCIKNSRNSVSLFLNPADSASFDLSFIRYELGNQIHWLLSNEELTDSEIDFTYLRRTQIGLRRYLKQEKESKIYFVIDGLDEMEADRITQINEILQDLPLGAQGVFVLLSGSEKKLKSLLISNKHFSKEIPLNPFSFPEVREYIERTDNSLIDYIHDIYKITRGIPERLESIRRLKLHGRDINEILNDVSNEEIIESLYSMEWSQVDIKNNLQIKVLSFLSFDNKKLHTEMLAKLLNEDKTKIDDCVSNLSFIKMEVEKDFNFISFINDTFKAFTKTQLKQNEKFVLDSLVEFYLKDNVTIDSIINLSNLYVRINEWDRLLNLMTEENYVNLLEKSQSIDTLIQQAEKGIKAAKSTESYEDQFKFSLYKSTLLEFNKSNIWASEIEARIELGDYNSAVNIAQSAFLIEDRLKLLALTAKKFIEKKLVINPELIEKIRELYNRVNFETLGENIIDLASDLMYSCPDLAINLVEKSKIGAEGGNVLDWALASLAIEAFKVGLKEEKESLSDDIHTKIKDKRVKNLINGISYFSDKNTTNDLVEIIKVLENPSEKLFLLRNWLRLNKEKSNTEEIVRLALNIVIQSTEYVPNASVLRDIAITLPKVENINSLKALLDDFNSLNESVKQRGPTRDYVALNLILAEAELTYSSEKCIYRLYEIEYFMNEIEDASIRTDVMSLFLRKLGKLIEKDANVKSTISIDAISSKLQTNVNNLLRDCAFHYEAVKGVIRNLSLTNETYSELALNIALKLNTVIRRDSALLYLFDNYLHSEVQILNFNFIQKIYESIYYQSNRSTLILELLDYFFKNRDKRKAFFIEINTYIDRTEIISTNINKCFALVRAYLILKSNPEYFPEKLTTIKDLLHKTWDSIDSTWERVEVAYKIASDLAEEDNLLANQYLKIAEEEKTKSYTVSPEVASLYISTIKLAVRAFSGLSSSTLSEGANFSKLKSYIDQIPSISTRLVLWGDCALRLKKRKEDTLFNKIVEVEIKPNLKILNNFLSGDRTEILLKILPVLFIHHSDNALEIIEKGAHPDLKDFVYESILDFILTKCSIEDPYDNDYKCKKLTIEEVSDCCKILEKIKTDSIIYKKLKVLCDIISNVENNFTREQLANTISRLQKVIDNNLPDRLNISHQGYKIVSKAQLLRLRKANYTEWNQVLDENKSIPNLSDQIIIQYEILEALSKTYGSKYEVPKKEIVGNITKNLDQLTCFNERVERYSGFLEALKFVDRKIFETQLKDLFSKVVGSTDQSLLEAQKKLIDFAYKLDPKLAESLISNVDTDPARGRLGINLKNHYNLLKFRSEIFEKQELENDQLSEVSVMLLESLNSEKLSTKSLKELERFIKSISESSFNKTLSMSTYFVQNAVTKYQSTPHADVAIKKIFDAILFSAHIIGYLSRKHSKSSLIFVPTLTSITPEVNVFKAGEREKAIFFLNNWLQSISINKIDVCDAYFNIIELDLLKLFLSVGNNLEVTILTGIKHNKGFIDRNENVDNLIFYWNNISDEKPPTTKIVLVGKEKNSEPPFHDRWWIFNEGEFGLRVGTSFNSIGINKDSEISILKESEAKSIHQRIINEYANKNVRYYEGEKLNYRIFVL